MDQVDRAAAILELKVRRVLAVGLDPLEQVVGLPPRQNHGRMLPVPAASPNPLVIVSSEAS